MKWLVNELLGQVFEDQILQPCCAVWMQQSLSWSNETSRDSKSKNTLDYKTDDVCVTPKVINKI